MWMLWESYYNDKLFIYFSAVVVVIIVMKIETRHKLLWKMLLIEENWKDKEKYPSKVTDDFISVANLFFL